MTSVPVHAFTSSTSTPCNILFKTQAAFPLNNCRTMVSGDREINAVSVPGKNLLSQDMNQQSPFLESLAPTEHPRLSTINLKIIQL